MICPKCKTKYPSGHKFCPTCEDENGMPIRLVDEQQTSGGFNINLGDANAISGGVNLSDSHNVHNEDKSVHNISNVSNITNVAAQKTDMELLQEKKNLYLNECKRAYEDNVLEQSEIIALEEYRIKIGLDKVTADSILDSVRIMTERNARKTSLNPIAKTKLKILTDNLQKNEVKALMDQIDGIEALVNKYENDELSRKYFLVLAALKPEKCISLKENTRVDSYWKSFWSYLAYIKVDKTTEAENVLVSLDRFADYPEDNMTVLAVAGALMNGNKAEAKEYLDTVTGDYTPALQRFVDSIYLLLDPDMAKDMEANANTCAFYLVNFFNQTGPKERARNEVGESTAEEDTRIKTEYESKGEQVTHRNVVAEDEKKYKEEEKARNQITYIVMIKNVSNQVLATMTLWSVLKWRSADTPEKLKSLPCEAYRSSNESDAKEIFRKLSNGSMTLDIERVNGFGESVRKLYVLTISKINCSLQSVVSACNVLKLPSSTTTTQDIVDKLPIEALKTEDEYEALSIYNKLVNSGLTINIKMINGFGDTIVDNVPLYNVILKSIKPNKVNDMWMFTLPSYGIKKMKKVLPVVVSTVLSQESGQRIVNRLIEKGAEEVIIQPIEYKTEDTAIKREQIRATENPQSNSVYYNLELTKVTGSKVNVIKAITKSCGLKYQEAKEIVFAATSTIGNAIPTILKERLLEDEAIALKEVIEDSGAIVTLISIE